MEPFCRLYIGIPKGRFLGTHGRRIPSFSQTLLGEVGDEVADVEGGISLTAKVEVDEPEAISVDKNLVGVEVAVDQSGGMGGWGGGWVGEVGG